MVGGTDGTAGEAIAVIGLHARMPGSRDVAGFWRNLATGVLSIRQLEDSELLAAGETPERLAHKDYVGAVSLLDDVEEFDAAFFGYGRGEAARMDPQQRLFLQGARAALEDAGYVDEARAGTIGVFAGSAQNRYLLTNLIDAHGRAPPLDDLATLLGNEKDYLASRVSYHMGLTGPSLAVQTGCSSALVAVSLAAQALTSQQCDLALAGGVALRLPQRRGYVHVADGILSPDGHCRPFDARAAGTVFGSGVGLVVLKRLDEAVADGDTIHAVLRGIAVNNDGAERLGYTAPSVDRQAAVVALAQALAGVDPATIGFVEAHGTGTALGDPVEVAALSQAFGIGGARTGSVALGSLKGNVGHLDAAAGIAGLLKAVLAVEHGLIPPTLHFERANPGLGLERTPFFVNAAALPWNTDGAPRRAGVSSFGMGGTNAHAVIEQAPAVSPSGPSRGSQLLLLSARTAEALETASAELAGHLAEPSGQALADVAHTLRVGRSTFGHRRALVCADVGEARRLLAAPESAGVITRVPGEFRPPVTFLFPGQGSQHLDMARELYQDESVFRHHVDSCCAELRPHLDLDLREVLYPPGDDAAREAARQRLRGTDLAQPALFVIEYALARLWMEWGVRADVMLGHSLGELVAACLNQVFRPEHALQLVALRGRLMAELPAGAMLSVPLAPDDLDARLSAGLALAAANHPAISTVSGPCEAIDALADELGREGLRCRRLEVSHAFHSSMMEPAMEAFAAEVGRLPRKPPEHAFVSNVTGRLITPAEATDPSYWAQQLRRTVRFSDGVAGLGDGPRVFLEVGPGRALTTLVGELIDGAPGQVAVPCLRHPSEERSDTACLLEAAGALWAHGVPFDGQAFVAGESRGRVPLPTTPFARTRCWIEPSTEPAASRAGVETSATASAAAPRPALLRSDDPADWFSVPSWTRRPLPGALDRGTPAGHAASRQGETPRPRWLLFTDEQGTWDALVTRLSVTGDVVAVVPSDRFQFLGPGRFALDPGDPAGFRRLVETLGEDLPGTVAMLWLATPAARDPDAALRLGTEVVPAIAAALGDRPARLVVVTERAVDVIGEVPVPEQAAVGGACRAVALERPNLSVGTLDVEVPDGAAVDALTAELRSAAAGAGLETAVAWRGGHRWVECLEPVALPAPDAGDADAGEADPGLRDGGVYLITGGLGGIGLTLAEFLVESRGARVALCGRSGLPAVDEANPLDARTAGRAEAVHRLRARGGEVLVLTADVTDPAAMLRAFAATRETFGALHGVIHAAGLPLQGALAAKVAGTRVLAALCTSEIELLVLCSSVSTVFGGLGQADYCAGNAFMDAFAVSRRGSSGPRVVSIGWDTWRELGMAVDAPVPVALEARKRAVLAAGLTRPEGVEVFRRALAADQPHLLVSTTPLTERRRAITSGAPATVATLAQAEPPRRAPPDAASPGIPEPPGVAELSGASPSPTVPPPLGASVPPGPPAVPTPTPAPTQRERIADDVTRIWCQLLGLDRAAPGDSFFEQGGNSLLATQMLARIREQYTDADLSLAGLFAEPTLGSLVTSVQGTHGGDVKVPVPAPGTAATSEAGASGAGASQASAARAGAPRLADRILATPGDARHALLEEYLRAEVITALDGAGEVPADGGLDRLDLTLLAAHLTWVVRRDLDLPIYPPEVRQRPSLDALARLVDEALTRRERGAAAVSKPMTGRPEDTSVGFVLSAPRSGSTLLRLMLSAHPALFCPPELFLLDHASMADWQADDFSDFYRDGLVRAVMAAAELDYAAALARVEALVAADASTAEVYDLLRGQPGLLLVDKTPTYALGMACLQRAEQLFDRPRYVGLVRHPLAVIESFVRNRLDRIRRVRGDPHELGERYWVQCNHNVLAFGEQIGAERFRLVHYEDLVRDPEPVLTGVCAHLGVAYDAAVLDPYGRGRMFGGPGDPNIHRRGKIDPELADAWRSVSLPRPLGHEARELATRLGYVLPAED